VSYLAQGSGLAEKAADRCTSSDWFVKSIIYSRDPSDSSLFLCFDKKLSNFVRVEFPQLCKRGVEAADGGGGEHVPGHGVQELVEQEAVFEREFRIERVDGELITVLPVGRGHAAVGGGGFDVERFFAEEGGTPAVDALNEAGAVGRGVLRHDGFAEIGDEPVNPAKSGDRNFVVIKQRDSEGFRFRRGVFDLERKGTHRNAGDVVGAENAEPLFNDAVADAFRTYGHRRNRFRAPPFRTARNRQDFGVFLHSALPVLISSSSLTVSCFPEKARGKKGTSAGQR